ncbi:MFS transporter [Psychrobium sp. MM17-31]|uniref:MFS transporter n=1 Tax=Psychrobium sp. MM17-31 TaxID=2917758 RepID=UPI001EF598C4|nr:MFS transporter [Psychrobium sp. MM17-31]MCG7531643.1 MFS transporter [Psychrobium sp. MM17-31]
MSYTLLFTLLALGVSALVGRWYFKLPNNIWLLFFAQPLAMCATSLMVLVSGILGQHLAPDPEIATLPISTLIIGVAIAVIPANRLTNRIGRRFSLLVGLSIAVFGALVSAFAAMNSSFWLLVAGSILLGFSMSFVAQMRFCALESVESDDSAKALSILMVGGIFAAMLGPELAVAGKDWIASPHGFVGSFVGLAVIMVLSMLAISQLTPTQAKTETASGESRSLLEICKQPIFLVALASAGIGYGVMSYVMTATPLSMHVIDGHSLEQTKWVVQSHIIAMYLPSLFSAWIVRKLGLLNVMLIGVLCYLAVVLFALLGHSVMHYWWVMVLLGVGWNFLFSSGTLLLPKSYQSHERLGAQAVNDFSIFATQALVSLLAGVVLFNFGWIALVLVGLPFVLAMLAIVIFANKNASIVSKLGS